MVVDANEVVLGTYHKENELDWLSIPVDGLVVLLKLKDGDLEESQTNRFEFLHTKPHCDGARYVQYRSPGFSRLVYGFGRKAVWATTPVGQIAPHAQTRCPVGSDIMTGAGCECYTGTLPEYIYNRYLASPVLDLSAAVPPFRIK